MSAQPCLKMEPSMLRGKEQGQTKKILPQSSPVIHKINIQNGLVIVATNPEESLVNNLIEPDPNDPTFAALCHNMEFATGVPIQNNPANENPSYFFDEPSELEPSLDNERQDQGEKSQVSEDVNTVGLEGQGQDQPTTPRAQKIIRDNGLEHVSVISPEESPEKKKRRMNAEKNHIEIPITPVTETKSEGDIEDIVEAYSPPPVNQTIGLNNTIISELDVQIESDSDDDVKLVYINSNDVSVEAGKEKNLQVQTLNDDSGVSEVSDTSRIVRRVSLPERTVTTENSRSTVSQGEGALNNVSFEEDDDLFDRAEFYTNRNHSPMTFDFTEYFTGLRKLTPVSQSPPPSKEAVNLKMIDDIKAEMAKPYPDMMLIKDWMKNTFDFRRKMIKKSSASTIWETFPAFKYSDVIRQEYLDVSEKNIDNLAAKLDPIFDNLLDVKIGNLQKLTPLLRSAVTELNNRKLLLGSFDLMRLRRNVGMLAFCTKHIGPLCDGKIFSSASQLGNPSEDMEYLTPFIVLNKGTLVGIDGETSMDIYVEKIKVGSTESFYDAVLTLYMMYWVMWMEYEQSSKPIFKAFDALLKEKRKYERHLLSSGAENVRW